MLRTLASVSRIRMAIASTLFFRWFAMAVAILWSSMWTTRAQAETGERALALTWTAPEPCPQAPAIQAQVLKLAALGGRSVSPLDARGTIESDGQTWQLVLTTRFENTSGERRLSASSCAALSDAAVVLMALILNPESEVKSSKPPEPRVEPRPSQPVRVRGLVDVHAGLHAGVAGVVGPEIGAGGGVAIDAASLHVDVNYAPPLDVHLAGSAGPGGRLWFVAVNGVGCWQLGTRIRVGPCAGLAFTRLDGQGIGVTTPNSAVTRWVSLVFRLSLGVPLGRVVSLRAAGQALVPTHRPTLYLDDLGAVQRPAAIGGEGWLGVELALP